MIDFAAFADELVKISQAAQQPAEFQPEGVVTKDRALKALRTGLLWAGGYGVGTALGNMIGRKIAPGITSRFQNLSPQAKAAITLGVGGAGTMLSLAKPYIFADTMRRGVYGDEWKSKQRLQKHRGETTETP